MNRIIKFRAWDVLQKTMIDSSQVLKDFHFYCNELVPNPYILMQFTGLIDKNGKEIYEGDFLIDADDSEPMRHRIVWIEDGAKFEIETLEDEEGNWGSMVIDELSQLVEKNNSLPFEVIGNVWENPSLLQASSQEKK